MEYSVKRLAVEYAKHLAETNYDVKLPKARVCDINTYNEYNYIKLMHQYDKLYSQTDSLYLTEQFLKGD